jgi:RNA polymerase sigma-70 factor (ECF subfamily)
MVSVLVKIFGSENYELAEDVVQDALLRALETWKYRGIPENPRAWLYRAARNKAIDIIRREKHNQTIDFSDPERKLLTSEYSMATAMDNCWQDNNMKDDFLGMMYACCYPDISEDNQITFILKSLCGFSTKEIAKSFLTTEDTISKRLYRTKEHFRKIRIRPQIPTQKEITSRTNAVLNSVYLMFNEGYNSTHLDKLIREDLISQAMLLCKSLIENEKTRLPETYALLALMCLHSSRNQGRLTIEGELIPLKKQDRSKWNRELISMGNDYLNKSAFGEILSSFHLEAAIAYEHCTSKDYESTDWKTILVSYQLFSCFFWQEFNN